MSKKRDERRDAAQNHIARMSVVFRKENMDAIATAKRYKPGQMETMNHPTPRFDSTHVAVEDSDSVSAVMSSPAPVAVLDFASYHNPGGGYENGAWAQEEALCSESNLYNVLDTFRDSFYTPHKKTHNSGLYTSDAIYLSDIQFVRDGNIKAADVIVVAAPNAKAANDAGIGDAEVEEALRARVNTVMNIAAEGGCDNLVLGAFGCGVFANEPEKVAGMFKAWLDENDGVFEKVVFAIPSGGANFDAFSEVFADEKYDE